MIELSIVQGGGRMGVHSIVICEQGLYFHFASKEQALLAMAKAVEHTYDLKSLVSALKKLCGDDYYAPGEEETSSWSF